MRKILADLLKSFPNINLKYEAKNGKEALEIIDRHHSQIDIITLDIEMPKLNGIAFLEAIQEKKLPSPPKILVISSLTGLGSKIAFEALEKGAFDVIRKPDDLSENSLKQFQNALVEKFSIIIYASKQEKGPLPTMGESSLPTASFEIPLIAIGGSTGAPRVLVSIFKALSGYELPPIVIVQHMPIGFSQTFCEHLTRSTKYPIVEVFENTAIQRGKAYLAKSGLHIQLTKQNGDMILIPDDSPPVHGHKPSIDVLFESIANRLQRPIIAVLLSGMGRDGAQGIHLLKKLGSITIGQDQASSVVYGMVQKARDLGAIDFELPYDQIGPAILHILSLKKVKKVDEKE